MQREWTIVDDDSVTLASVTAETAMGGAALQFHGTWHSPPLLERYAGILLEVSAWLTEHKDKS